jgi:hypothetical protein
MKLLVSRKNIYGWIPDLPDQRDYSYKKLVLGLPQISKKNRLKKFLQSGRKSRKPR